MAQVLLRSRGRRALALLIGVLVLGGGSLGILRWLVARQARSAWDRAALERALRLESDDALLHHRLGQWEEFSLAEGDLQRALLHYRRATELNPYESRYWLDLGDARLLSGDSAGAEAAMEKALRADPRTPETLWRIGNFWLRARQPARAFPYFRQVLLNDRSLILPVIQTSHRALGDPEIILREVLPAQPLFLIPYLRFLVREHETPAAARVWQVLVGVHQPFEAQQVLFYVDYLLATHEAAQAEKAWRDLQGLRLLPVDPPTPGAAGPELLHNAMLRAPILNGGFDWRVVTHPRVVVTLGPGRQGEDPPAVTIRFSGEDNLHYRHFFQYVVVEPRTRYRFQAWVSTEEVTTDSGPRLEMADAYDPQVPVAYSPELVGTDPWTQLQVEFVTGPQTRLLRVGIVRLPSQRLENRIGGTVRAAEFSLRRVAGGS